MDNQSHELTVPEAKVIRMPSLKRGKDDVPLDDRVKLERVLGLTVGSNAALDCNPALEQVAYPAGCTVVFFNVRKNKQSHILNTSKKTITCLAFGPGGKYLATGECGHVPSLRIWSVQDGLQVSEFQGHKYGINCVAFSPNNKYVVSVGSQHDMIVNVWDWKNNIKVASNKVSTRVKAVSFSENGKYFVTVGMRHVKFWYLEHTRSAKYNEPVPLTGRSAILGEQRDNYFCDVACGLGQMGDSTYAITKSGLLCEFSIRRLLDKWVELRTRSANCMTVGESFIFIGCADGIIRCFSPVTLEFLVTLPRTHYLGVDVALGLDISHLLSHPQDAKYPDAIALAYDDVNKKLTCVYNDHSMYVWDVREIRRVGKSHSFLYHSACIWGVEIYPEMENQEHLPVPPGSFITCSSDDTIRVWNLNNLGNNNPTVYRRNIYSNELLKVLYMDKNLTYLKDLDLSSSSSEKTDTSYDGKNGVRSVRISPNGLHLASGDREGNIRIHELSNLQQTVMIEAHDAEVLCLEYTKESHEKLLASASRDRLIHVFNVSKGYECVQTLDDHSSSITAVRFINARGQLQMVSCSADKSIIFRQFHPATPDGTMQFIRDHNVAGKTTLYDMEVDCGQKHIMTACQDRNIRVYNVNSGKHSKTFKGSISEDGTLIKVSLDNSGIYIATSCTDKSLSIYDYYSGECMATMLGHSELVTGLKFTNDCKRLISASGDGCIFIWKLPRDMTVTMQARLDQQAVRRGKRTICLQSGMGISDGPELVSDEEPESFDIDRNANIEKMGFKFSDGQLPAWARREIEDQNKSIKMELSESPAQPIRTGFSVIKVNKPPQGRWAQRIENNEIMIATFSPDKQERIVESNSKDSSLESHTGKNDDELKMKELQGNEGIDFDGDVEDSDIEIETHYYPASSDNKTEFTVNANNIDELRRSTRKYKKQQMVKASSNSLNLEHGIQAATSNPATSVSGSQDSDEDDLEDVSSETETPSIERSLGFNFNSVSTESLDLFGQRESYFKNNFESLHSDSPENRKDPSGKSISSQYLVRNTAVINAAKQTKTEIEKMKKREELRKRLEDTRRTLKSSGLSPSPLKASQSICDLSRYPERNGNVSKSHFHASQGKQTKVINLLTILYDPTNKKLDSEKEKFWTSDKGNKDSKIYPRVIGLNPKHMADGPKETPASLTLNAPTTSNPGRNVKISKNKADENKNSNTNRNIFYGFPFDSSFDRKNSRRYYLKKNKTKSDFMGTDNTRNINSCHGSSHHMADTDQEKLESDGDDASGDGDGDGGDGGGGGGGGGGCAGNASYHECKVSHGEGYHKRSETMMASEEFEGNKCLKDVKSSISRKPENSFYEQIPSVKEHETSDFSLHPNMSLPDSPVSESWSLSESICCLTDTEAKKAKRRSCSFYVDLKSLIEKKRESERSQKEKEKLLLAHDHLGNEKAKVKVADDRSVESVLEDFENDSDGEFSSDSLESMSMGQKPPRRCISDHQIFSKEFRGSFSFSSQKNTEDFSDTDFSGLNSLQGSGDLLDMLEKDSAMEKCDRLDGHASVDILRNRPNYGSIETILPREPERGKINKSSENIIDKNSEEIKTFRKCAKKPDAFFVELSGSPRKSKPTLKAKKSSVDTSKDQAGLPSSPKPVIGGGAKKGSQTGKKLSLKCGQQVLPSKVFQDEDVDDEDCLRRAISLSDLSASPVPQSGPSEVSGKTSSRCTNLIEFNNARSTSRGQPMVRCSSVGVLSRLEPGTDGHTSDGKKFEGTGPMTTGKSLMRPTISSQNKVATTGAKVVNSALNKRRATAFSSVNLTTVGVNDDSSSEETGFARRHYSADKSSFSSNCGSRRQSNLGRYGSLKDLSHKAKEVTQRLSGVNPKKNKNQEVDKNIRVDVAAAPLTKQLCSSVTTQLSQDIDNLIVLHKRLTLEVDKSQNRAQLEQMIEELEKLAIETQLKLGSLTSKIKNNNSMIRNQLSTNSSNFLGNNLGLITPNNVASAPNSFLTNSNNPNLMTNVDVSRISEMLISVVQQYTENQQNNQKN